MVRLRRTPEEHRQNLFDALERLLANRPFPEITIPHLLEEAGISRATYYQHFEDKATLLLATAETVFSSAEPLIGAWWMAEGGISRAQLESALSGIFDLYRDHAPVLRALADARTYEPVVRDQMAGMFERFVDMCSAHIERGQASGHVRQSIPAYQTAGWIVWTIERGCNQLVVDAAPEDVPAYLHSLVELIWNGLYEPA